MSDNAFVRLDGLKAALSRVKTKVDSDIASAISESTSSLTSTISSGDSNTLNSAKSYVDGIKTTLDSSIASTLSSAKGYTDGIKTAIETNLTNHTSNTSNPHSVTYSQVGAAASSHTHTESDITDLGNYSVTGHTHTLSDITDLGSYASSSHTHTLANITDVTATASEVNNTSGSTSNIQTQINSILNLIFPILKRNNNYNVGDKVLLPNKPFVYLEALTSGYTSNDDNMINFNNLTYDYENDEIIQKYNVINANLNNLEIGNIYKDNNVLWYVDNLLDGHQIGEIILKGHTEYPSIDGYASLNTDNPLVKLSKYNNNGKYDVNLDGIRLIKSFIDHRKWTYISSNQLHSYSYNDNNITFNIDDKLFDIDISISNTSVLDNNILNYKNSNDFNLLLYFAFIQIIKFIVNSPLTMLTPLTSINSADINVYNNNTNLSYTETEYLNFANGLINSILSAINNTGANFDLSISTANLSNHFIKMNYYNYLGDIQSAGLPNIIGTIGHVDCSFGAYNPTRDGAFYKIQSTSSRPYQLAREAKDNSIGNIGFNARRYNSIYGDSATVTPQNISLIPYIKL